MPELGDTLGRYTLLKRLATGGMGEIFLAARMGPLGFASPVALKVLRDELATDVSFIEMLVDEAKISMFLNHQNVVSVLDFGEEDGRYYIAMEFVQGVTLKNILDSLKAQGRRLELSTALYIANELCRALKYAHTRTNHAGEPLNIVHRDVTPANVLMSIQGEVKLTDFGIARAKNRVHQTQAGVLKGKFGYMAPEMLRYEQIDARADLFCAGVILYEMVAGQHPVEGASIMEAITRLEEKDVRPPSNFNPKVPRELDAVVMKALEPKPVQRWATAHELGQGLQDMAFIDPSRRIELRHGADSVAALIRELFPAVLEPALPRDHADKMFALARERSSLVPSANPDPIAETAPPPPSSSRGSARPASQNGNGISVRPVIDAPRMAKAESSRVATREAVPAIHEAEPATIIPRHGRSHTPATASVIEPESDTDEHAKNALSAAMEDATANYAAPTPEEVRRARMANAAGPTAEDQELPTGEIVIRFPDSSTDRSRLREELLDEPSLPAKDRKNRAALDRAHEEERTYASPEAFPEPARADDGRTVAGMEVPDWEAMGVAREPSPQVIEPNTALDEVVRSFAEDELPVRNERAPNAYDDAATAFSGPEGYAQPAPASGYSDDRTAFGVTAAQLADASTIIPDVELKGVPEPEKYGDDTLLDGLDRDAIERAKAELGMGPRKAGTTPVPMPDQDDELVADTRLRQDALIDDAVSAAFAATPASKRPGLRSPSQGGDRPSPAPPTPTGLGVGPAPPGKPRPQPGRTVAREVRAPNAADPASRPPAPAGAPGQKVEIGSATGRWMRGELAAQDLSWGDDAAARRAVATRNAAAGPSQPPPADPRRTNAGVPRPGMGTQGAFPMPQPPMPPGYPPGAYPPNAYPPGAHPQGANGTPHPGQIPFPHGAPPAARSSRGLSLALAAATVVVALAAVATVVLRTKIAWPEVSFQTEPPGAAVRIDERVMSERTPATFPVKPGTPHRVEVRLEGYVPREVPGIDLGYFGSRAYQITLERIRPKIRISPVEGRVFVNDVLMGSGSEVVLDNVAPSGELKLRVEADGYISWSQTFPRLADLPPSLDVPLSAEPPPAPSPSPSRPGRPR